MTEELKIPLPQILTYSVSLKPNLPKLRASNFDWLAVYFNPAHELPIPMHFYGASEDEALEKATTWWIKRNRVVRADPVEGTAIKTGIGRGQGNTGTKWMYNPKTKEKQRVSKSLVAEYVEKGYKMGQGRTV